MTYTGWEPLMLVKLDTCTVSNLEQHSYIAINNTLHNILVALDNLSALYWKFTLADFRYCAGAAQQSPADFCFLTVWARQPITSYSRKLPKLTSNQHTRLFSSSWPSETPAAMSAKRKIAPNCMENWWRGINKNLSENVSLLKYTYPIQ